MAREIECTPFVFSFLETAREKPCFAGVFTFSCLFHRPTDRACVEWPTLPHYLPFFVAVNFPLKAGFYSVFVAFRSLHRLGKCERYLYGFLFFFIEGKIERRGGHPCPWRGSVGRGGALLVVQVLKVAAIVAPASGLALGAGHQVAV